MGRRTLGTETLWEEIWPMMPGERQRSAFKMCKEKGVALFWVGKGKENKVVGIFGALLYFCSPSVAILYLILTLKTPRGRYQPHYINGEPEAQRGWDIGPGCQEIVNGSPELGGQRVLCTALCCVYCRWLGDAGGREEEGEGMTCCPSLKTFESERSITDNHAWTIAAKQLPWH